MPALGDFDRIEFGGQTCDFLMIFGDKVQCELFEKLSGG